MYENKNKFVQFELWKDCKIGCKFCCNKGQLKINKVESLKYVLDKLKEKDIEQYNEIGFIGGEFFNGELESQEIEDLFYLVFSELTTLNFEKIYIATSLIYNLDEYLIPFLKFLQGKNILQKVIICTSYDVKYRFKTQSEVELWKRNMLFLYEHFSELRLHTEIILTEWFLKAVLNDNFKINDFKQAFHTAVDYIEPSSGLFYKDKIECEKDIPGFFPRKETFIAFLMKCSKDKSINLHTFLSMELRSNILYFIENGKRCIAKDRRKGDGRCELINKNKRYEIGFINSDTKMIDIVKAYNKLWEGD